MKYPVIAFVIALCTFTPPIAAQSKEEKIAEAKDMLKNYALWFAVTNCTTLTVENIFAFHTGNRARREVHPLVFFEEINPFYMTNFVCQATIVPFCLFMDERIDPENKYLPWKACAYGLHSALQIAMQRAIPNPANIPQDPSRIIKMSIARVLLPILIYRKITKNSSSTNTRK